MAGTRSQKVEKRKALRLLVTGGRDYDDEVIVDKILKRYKKKAAAKGLVLVVIQGGARGLDNLVKEWCKKYGIPCLQVDAQWDYYRNAAGPIRNGWMVEFCDPTHCYVFPGGTGTNDMREKAEASGLYVKGHYDEDKS